MKNLKKGTRLPLGRLILTNRHRSRFAFWLLAAALFAGAVAVCALAYGQQAKPASDAQASSTDDELKAYEAASRENDFAKRAAMLLDFVEKYPKSKLLQKIDYEYMKKLDKDEYNAYRSARREADAAKRAAMLLDFIQKYPKSTLMMKADYELIKPLEDEYNDFDAARQEPDFAKRAPLLIEFLQKYPQSALTQNAAFEYMQMLTESSQNKQYELLESLAEKWLKIHPNDKTTLGFVAEAANKLQKFEKSGEILETIYRIEPSPTLAREIYTCYQKTENAAKQAEWAQKLLKIPEFENDYMLRYEFVMRYSRENNLPKAAEYAQLTLRSAGLAQKQDEKSEEQIRKVRRACHHVIGSNLMEKGNYAGAIAAFKEAVKAERYAEGYYRIGACLDQQKQVEDAMLYYAMAELVDGESGSKAKARLETLYKVLHNNTLIGIDKVYQKAKDALAQPSL